MATLQDSASICSSTTNSSRTTGSHSQATADFKKALIWVALLALIMVAGALFYLSSTGNLQVHLVVSTIVGIFFSVLLGCGLFSLAFFSDKSGHDQEVTDATEHNDPVS